MLINDQYVLTGKIISLLCRTRRRMPLTDFASQPLIASKDLCGLWSKWRLASTIAATTACDPRRDSCWGRSRRSSATAISTTTWRCCDSINQCRWRTTFARFACQLLKVIMRCFSRKRCIVVMHKVWRSLKSYGKYCLCDLCHRNHKQKSAFDGWKDLSCVWLNAF